ncbi:helix-turn-helix transcriptional regulator [Novispirillum itersonii]|uniref:AraC-like DNA-binding protein n=1 Tax=Novispirillum itersonii TaxID=189 RepID=A0A7X0DMH3_NOVIT|nr:AraC family transcriptional regulator [Novispirillum itersonii]MBB6211083.1 AraC-like DNA-binding protein [Novispirillum itersonii]
MRIPGLGQVIVWPGGNLWIGRPHQATTLHAHHAVEVCFSLRGTLRMRTSTDAAWISCQAAVVPSRQPHALDAVGSDVVLLLCEPETLYGHRIAACFPATGICPLPPGLTERLRDLFCPTDFITADTDDLTARSLAALRLVAGESGPRGLPLADPRILRATATLKERTDQSISLEEIAATVHLSPGRFRHLFVEEIGTPFRRYLLWLRLQRALSVALDGESWAQAAQAANFADQAHLSRTFRQMFGIAPTFLTPQSGGFLPESQKIPA